MIRRADPSDADSIARLVNAAFARYIERIGKPPAPMLLDYGTEIRTRDVWVSDDAAGVRAVLVIHREADHWLIDVVAVDPSAQGSGLGTQLLAHAEAEAARCGVRELRLFTNEQMTENLSYYPRRGFTETGRRAEDGYCRVYFSKPVTTAV